MNNFLLQQIKAGESQTVEFKTSFGKETIKSIVSLSNSDGGYIFLGVSNSGKINGLPVDQETLKEWVNSIKMSTDPALYPNMNKFVINGKSIVVIKVAEYPIKPVSFNGRFYKRIGSSNHLLSVDEIAELHINSLSLSFDSFMISTPFSHLDEKVLAKYFNRVRVAGRFKTTGQNKRDLEKLGLIKRNKITRAAELLFGNHKTAIHIGRFKTATTIIDDILIKSPLIVAVDEAMDFMKRNISLGYEFTGELQRKDKWQFPLQVLVELLLNSIIHKDYRNPTDVIIKIFDDRIEFSNPGTLFGKLKVQDLETDNYLASHRNKLLAEGFYLLGDVEKYGTGFIRMREILSQDYPELETILEEISGCFRVILRSKKENISSDKVAISSDKVAISSDTETKEQQITRFLRINKKITNSQARKITGLSESGARKLLKRMVGNSILISEGERKNRYYYLKQK